MADGVLIITSAAYAGTELVAEFGMLPAAFLPVGHSRLYDLQLDALAHLPGRRVISLPESFVLPEWDAANLIRRGVDVIRVPDGLRLGDSVLFSLNVADVGDGPVRVLHGDTLIYDAPDLTDVIGTGASDPSYAWGMYDAIEGKFREAGAAGNQAIAGYFCFSNVSEIRKALAKSAGDFLLALNLYNSSVPIRTADIRLWLDFGHLQTYYRSRCNVRTQRSFNSLSIDYQKVTKTSRDQAKMDAEACWFESIPASLRGATPAYLGRTRNGGDSGYTIQYLPIPSLHEMFVFGNLAPNVWRTVFAGCFDFMNSCVKFADVGGDVGGGGALLSLTVEKTVERTVRFASASDVDLNRDWRFRGRPVPSINKIIEETSNIIRSHQARKTSVMHGDFCFTNIFFDPRSQGVRVIDPRGYIDQLPTVFGDIAYDLAKMSHSLSGRYDYILANRYYCEGNIYDIDIQFPSDQNIELLPSIAAEFSVGDLRIDDLLIDCIVIQLFLAMLPLHADRPDRQRAFLANAMRLYLKMVGK